MTTKQEIVELLKTNPKAVARALVVLNERQTATEQCAETTINHNGVGFTPADARMGTSMAQFYTKRGYLTDKQVQYWLKPNVRGVPRICKYAGQLLEVAQAKAQAAAAMAERIQEKNEFAALEAKQEQAAFDLGNMLEELMCLQEQFDDYLDSDDEAGVNELGERIATLKREIASANNCMVQGI